MAQDDQGKRTAAPYVAYQSLRTFIGPLKEHVIPNRVDKSLMGNQSGATQAQLMTALRFLGLIDDESRPTDFLKKLVLAYETDGWGDALGSVLNWAYADLFKLPLATISPSEFNEKFKEAYPSEGETLRKGITFFLNAAREAGISLSPYLTKNTKPRAGSTKRRPRVNGRKSDLPEGAGALKDFGGAGEAGAQDQHQQAKALEYQLIDLMSEPDVDDAVKQSIWALVQYLMARKAKVVKSTAVET